MHVILLLLTFLKHKLCGSQPRLNVTTVLAYKGAVNKQIDMDVSINVMRQRALSFLLIRLRWPTVNGAQWMHAPKWIHSVQAQWNNNRTKINSNFTFNMIHSSLCRVVLIMYKNQWQTTNGLFLICTLLYIFILWPHQIWCMVHDMSTLVSYNGI